MDYTAESAANFIKNNLHKYKGSNLGLAMDLSIRALKKQIPKMVVPDGDDEQDYIHCPLCNEVVGVNNYFETSEKFCCNCGQALKY